MEGSLVPTLLFYKWENSLVNCLYCFGSNIFVVSHKLDCEFKSVLANVNSRTAYSDLLF